MTFVRYFVDIDHEKKYFPGLVYPKSLTQPGLFKDDDEGR